MSDTGDFFSTGGNGREAEESHRVQFISSGFGLVLRFLLRVVVKFIRFLEDQNYAFGPVTLVL